MSPRHRLPSLLGLLSLVLWTHPGLADPDNITPDPLAYISPSREYKTVHTQLDLDIYFDSQTIAGSVTHEMQSLRSALSEISLNCVGLEVESVTLDGQAVGFEYPVTGGQSTSWFEGVEASVASDKLVIQVPEPLKRGDRFTVTVNYRGAPKIGLYWIQPERGIPEKRNEVWSQGEGEDNRYWIPSYDYPNDTATYEGTFRVPRGYYALSNGTLISTEDIGDRTQFTWKLDQPVVNYLFTLAAAEYDIHEDVSDGVPLYYLVPPGTDPAMVERGYGKTPKMMEFFNRTIGIDYPFSKYAQVTVQNFVWGGMENASATTMYMGMLYDESKHLTRDRDDLVSHELAHQWWGDLVTCREWNHMWLNEGFATYYENLFLEFDKGNDAFRYMIFEQNASTITKDDTDPRPVVTDFFNRRDARNSNNVYNKGAAVLHMLRFILGDELYHAVVKHYAETHRHGVVETSDFTRAVKDVTGENLDWFFEQWLYLTGHPKFTVTKSWDRATGMLHLNVKQTQELSRLWPLFRTPIDVEITTDEATDTYRILIDKADQDFFFNLSAEPKMVIFDKGDWILKTLDFRKPASELVYQLENGDYMAAVHAAIALGEQGDAPESVPALLAAMQSDQFYGLRHQAALALGRIGTEEARSALLEGVQVENARVRLAATEALGEFKQDEIAAAGLQSLTQKDPATGVRAKAVESLVKMKSKLAADACRNALSQESDLADIRNAGLSGLATLENTDALPLLKTYAEPGNSRNHRHTAITAYAALARKLERERDREAAADFLETMLDDWYLTTRKTVITALGSLGEQSALAALRRAERTDPLESNRKHARATADNLESPKDSDEKIKAMEARVKELEDTLQSLEKDMKLLQIDPEPPKPKNEVD